MAQRRTEERARPRPGGHRLRPEVVAHHQRERMLAAAVDLVAEKGFRAVTVSDIVKRGKVARARFYDNFANKEECFLAACESGLAEAIDLVEVAAGTDGPFAERVSAAVEAALDYMTDHPALTRACLLGAPELGAEAIAPTAVASARVAELLRAGRSELSDSEPPADLEESVVGGLYWIVYQAVLSGEPERLGDLRPDLVEFALAPYIGVDRARSASVVETPTA